MGSPTSRRAFLLGRRTPPSEWGKFCARLSRTCSGQVRWEDEPEHQQAWLIPAREGDLLHAHALCREYRVQMALAGFQSQEPPADKQLPRLWIESGSAWAHRPSCDDSGLIWRADGGTQLKDLQQVGVQAVQGVDPEQTVAQWMASEASSRWPTGQGAGSGIVQVQVMLADGTVAVLGPFGANATAPLRSMTVQQMIPKLFELAGSEFALQCAQAVRWPIRFRLDALMPAPGADINLAWLFAGHGASLGWVQAVWFKREAYLQQTIPKAGSELPDVSEERRAGLARQLKESFDPIGIFP